MIITTLKYKPRIWSRPHDPRITDACVYVLLFLLGEYSVNNVFVVFLTSSSLDFNSWDFVDLVHHVKDLHLRSLVVPPQVTDKRLEKPLLVFLTQHTHTHTQSYQWNSQTAACFFIHSRTCVNLLHMLVVTYSGSIPRFSRVVLFQLFEDLRGTSHISLCSYIDLWVTL